MCTYGVPRKPTKSLMTHVYTILHCIHPMKSWISGVHAFVIVGCRYAEITGPHTGTGVGGARVARQHRHRAGWAHDSVAVLSRTGRHIAQRAGLRDEHGACTLGRFPLCIREGRFFSRGFASFKVFSGWWEDGSDVSMLWLTRAAEGGRCSSLDAQGRRSLEVWEVLIVVVSSLVQRIDHHLMNLLLGHFWEFFKLNNLYL